MEVLVSERPLHMKTVQRAFVEGVDTAQGIYTLKRIAELAKVWIEPAVVIQIDFKKASDKIAHKAVTDAPMKKGTSTQLNAVLFKM